MTVTKEITNRPDGTQSIKETTIHPDGRREVKSYQKAIGDGGKGQ